MLIKYFGHATFMVEFPSRKIMFDPWFQSEADSQGGRLVKAACTAEQAGKPDLICITHEHFDHFNPHDVSIIQGKAMAQVVAPQNVLSGLDVPARCKVPVQAGDNFTIMGVDIKVMEAKHPQSAYAVSYLVSTAGKSVFFAGDTYDHYGFSGVNADVAFIPIGGKYTMDVFNAVTAVKKMKARVVIPMHYGTFKDIQADPADFARRVKSDKVTPIVLSPGQQVQV
ncbi:MAG: MBL fold metallo-hydrolase [Candidatus Micrarchaeota archaeon]